MTFTIPAGAELVGFCPICEEPFRVKMSGGQIVCVKDDQRPLPSVAHDGRHCHASCIVAEADSQADGAKE